MAVLKRKAPSTLPGPPSAGKPEIKTPKSIPKGEKKNAHEPKKEESKKDTIPPRPVRESTQASEPVTTDERQDNDAEFRPAYTRESNPEASGQMTRLELLATPLAERLERWKRLNQDTSRFTTLLKPHELPKKVTTERIPGGAKNPTMKGVYWCPFCGDWQPFKVFSYTGYTKCCGCGISARDFYTCMANNLWNKE